MRKLLNTQNIKVNNNILLRIYKCNVHYIFFSTENFECKNKLFIEFISLWQSQLIFYS